MPSKRRVTKSREYRITPEALAAFKAGDSIRLHRALGLRPWQPSPLDADDGPPPWPPGSSGREFWPLACDLRAELVAALQQKESD